METSLALDPRQPVALWKPPEIELVTDYDWNDPSDPPSLQPAEIARLSKQFYDEMAPHQRLWALCRDVVTDFRAYTPGEVSMRAGMEMAYFNRVRDLNFNITLPQLRNASSRLEISMPSWGTRSASDSIGDLMSAAADEQALTYYSQASEFPYAAMEMVDWGIMFGTSAMLTAMKNGSVSPEVFGPDRIRSEPGIQRPDDSRFLGVSRITTKGQLRKRFPEKSEQIEQAAVPLQQMNWWSGYQRMAPDRVEVLEVYCRSGHWFLMCGSGGTVLASGWTPQGCMPLDIHRYSPLPTDFWGMGMVSQALAGQAVYSTSWNQIITNARLMSNPKILIPTLSGIAPDAFTSRAGEKIPYRLGYEPKAWQGQQLPQYAVQLPASAASAVADGTGIHASSQGKRLPGVVTGAAVNATVANDEVQFGVTKRDVKRITERHGRTALLYMQEYYPPDKYLHQFDRYGSAIGIMVNSASLSKDPQVFVESDSLFREDIEARTQRIQQVLQMGGFTGPEALKMMQTNRDPLRPQKPIADYVVAKKALAAVIANGFEVQDMRSVNPDGSPVMRKTVKFYSNDNFPVTAEVIGQFIRSDAFDALDLDKQDAVDALYEYLLQMMAPPDPNAQQGGAQAGGAPQLAKPKQAPGVPAGTNDGNQNAKGNSGGIAGGSAERKIQLQTAAAESSDEFSK